MTETVIYIDILKVIIFNYNELILKLKPSIVKTCALL